LQAAGVQPLTRLPCGQATDNQVSGQTHRLGFRFVNHEVVVAGAALGPVSERCGAAGGPATSLNHRMLPPSHAFHELVAVHLGNAEHQISEEAALGC
jgi:hypothetical protein